MPQHDDVSDAHQREVIAFLTDPRTHQGVEVTRIDTHSAMVFLAGPRVLKMKRAVKFPFLDYSTLEKRKQACEAELSVNRPYAPQIYRGVACITREVDGALALNGAGNPVEYAVDMVRFDEKGTLDNLPASEITPALAKALGIAVACAHQKAPLADGAAFIAQLAQVIAGNAQELEASQGLFDADAIARLTAASYAQLTRITPLLAQRGEKGHVRRGHGDLHLGNIVLIDAAPVLFDALEFDPKMASGDVFYDLAFLLMDLWERGHANAANIVLNTYLAEAGSENHCEALAALPLFLSLRAAIRAKVTLARAERLGANAKAKALQSAQDYFRLACTLIAPPPARLVAIGGLSGTGKSMLARGLAPHLGAVPGAVIVRSDVMRKHLFGKAEMQTLPHDAYTPDITAKIYGIVAASAARIAQTGHAAIADAVFAKADERSFIASTAQAADVAFTGLMLMADVETRIARVSRRTNDASDADAAIALRQEQYELGPIDWIIIDANGAPDETLARARKALDEIDASLPRAG